jgi:cobalt-zinc-cadmium efflux system outer membrane protein
MRFLHPRALPCLIALQAAAQPPLAYAQIRSLARPAQDQARAELRLAQGRLRLQETRGALREAPTLYVTAGPRRTPGAAAGTDRSVELDAPLFLAPGARSALETALGSANPLLCEAARREDDLRLRTAYLDAWFAARALSLREADLATVERWLQAARARFEAGADPAFQVTLVEGERLKALQELDAAGARQARAWGALAALAEVPAAPVPLADPAPTPPLSPEDLPRRLAASPLRQALLAQAALEERTLRLQEAVALSRWSLRGGFSREGQDSIARLGIAVRLPRPGEAGAIRRETGARMDSLRLETAQALADLEARVLSATARLQRAGPEAPGPDFPRAIEAVGLRLLEGRERPSEALPIRRQLLEAGLASLERAHARQTLVAELQALLPEVTP